MAEQIQVLMSVYNGRKYVRTQIESILGQADVEVMLLIRDDGSDDGTAEFLQEYIRGMSNVLYYQGENIGAARSFFDLLTHADCLCQYFAFADQDDYWLPDKLKRAVQIIKEEKNQDQPILYASQVIYANSDLSKRKAINFHNNRSPSFGNALVQNICIGCTEVFNRALLEQVEGNFPSCSIFHDWWLYLTAACFGKVIYDSSASIWYRQHENNEVGMQITWKKRWKNRISRYVNLKDSIHLQTADFLEQYQKKLWKQEHRAMAELVAGYRKSFKMRIKLVKNRKIYRQQKLDDMIYKILFLLGLL